MGIYWPNFDKLKIVAINVLDESGFFSESKFQKEEVVQYFNVSNFIGCDSHYEVYLAIRRVITIIDLSYYSEYSESIYDFEAFEVMDIEDEIYKRLGSDGIERSPLYPDDE